MQRHLRHPRERGHDQEGGCHGEEGAPGNVGGGRAHVERLAGRGQVAEGHHQLRAEQAQTDLGNNKNGWDEKGQGLFLEKLG